MAQHLTAEQRAQLEMLLTQRQKQLGRRLADQLQGQTRAERAREVLLQDPDDAAQRDGERDLEGALSDREQQDLSDVSAALHRLHNGAFAHCADCNAAIPFARMLAEPWALRCVACEGERELRAARRSA